MEKSPRCPHPQKGQLKRSWKLPPYSASSNTKQGTGADCTQQTVAFLSPWLSTNQSGFKRKDGTVPQLMRLTQTLSDAVDEQKYVGAVFFDLKKAFDRVWHKGLLAKIRFAGVTGGAHEWLASYLSERHQVTLVDGQLSSTNKLHAGVPQGAILSPLLFCVYMNDMPCRDSTNLFADDTSSYVIESNAAMLEEKLQLRTHNICIWFSKWLLSVNTEKSAIMVFRSQRMLPVCVQVFINKNIIPQVSSHRHLGLILHECLSWDCHIDHVVLKASAKLGFLRRLANRLDPLVIRDLYMFCILPAAEYASEVWSGLSTTDAIRLEKLNRRAARSYPKSSFFLANQSRSWHSARSCWSSAHLQSKKVTSSDVLLQVLQRFSARAPQACYRQLATCSKTSHNGTPQQHSSSSKTPEEYLEELSLLLCFLYMELPSGTHPFISYVCFH